ncbi:MAG: aminoacetone oxidase family FAD-binding enzyme [Flavobacteriaceae bacterium CG02_land_8_20_14_3_00_34_13]|nr:MAG: aminoacetone oxidase family FAD-binding enzyme [Flavobacteriaceae bacterium CG02_land_8_20_14_3_00_34_13]PIZ07107.1 MAG: aminoacetone oxidase family FAD-binding enzyme [Flavobacteriaceae bacterium CG_4_10_14_0_8_um_filter_34_31]
MKHLIDILIIGGGAAGFFTAINAAENNSEAKIVILERGKEVLTKVRISGGGRCNVTHAEFVPKELIKKYPRGEKELLGPFHHFMTGDTIEWFEKRGVSLKIEEDGRMFPETDSSQTIIDCFLSEVKRLAIDVKMNHSVKTITKQDSLWYVTTTKGDFITKNVVIATGSNPKIWQLLEKLGHKIIPPVPSLFTFHIKDARITDLSGISTNVAVKVLGTTLKSQGPLLITHWGMSGPAILKLSAWGARELFALDYTFTMQVNWLENQESEEALEQLKEIKLKQAKQLVIKYPMFELPRRLWQSLVIASGIDVETKWAEINKKQLQDLTSQLTESKFMVDGKSTFKEEFVTAGGVELKEIDFKTFESKLHKNLYLAGEVLNIDAITGGFNFQNCWTSGFLVAKAIL